MSFGAPVRNGIGIGLKASTSLSTRGGASGPAPGQQAFTTAGTFSWVAPAGVTSVSVVCVGAGVGLSGTRGRGGGGLGWKNSISVTPGESYTVQVGNPLSATVSARASWFQSNTLVLGGGAGSGVGANDGGIFIGDGGGNGGSGFRGGGGAGGYTGNGGNGAQTSTNATAGSGGGGGGGGNATTDPYGQGNVGGGGGGVGILGLGANGAAGTSFSESATGGTGGSSGSSGGNGSYVEIEPEVFAADGGFGGTYGGCPGHGGFNESGGGGAVRIIWGAGRAFPSTNTGNL